MSQHLHEELEQSVGEPPRSLDADAVLGSLAHKRRTLRNRIAGSVAGVAAVAGLVVVVPQLGLGGQINPSSAGGAASPNATPMELPADAASSTAVTRSEATSTASGAATTTTRTNAVVCPTASATPGAAVAIDWVPLVVWNGHDYSWWNVGPTAPRLGAEVTTIACTIGNISDKAGAGVPRPWPDRTATLLPVGTPVYAVQGYSTSCALASREGTVVTLYLSDAPACRTPTPSLTPSR